MVLLIGWRKTGKKMLGKWLRARFQRQTGGVTLQVQKKGGSFGDVSLRLPPGVSGFCRRQGAAVWRTGAGAEAITFISASKAANPIITISDHISHGVLIVETMPRAVSDTMAVITVHMIRGC